MTSIHTLTNELMLPTQEMTIDKQDYFIAFKDIQERTRASQQATRGNLHSSSTGHSKPIRVGGGGASVFFLQERIASQSLVVLFVIVVVQH